MRTKIILQSAFARPRLLLALLLCGIGASLGFLSFAATPSSGTLTTTSAPLVYTAGPFVVPNVTAQAGPPDCTAPMSCDDFALTVNVPVGTDATKQVKIKVEWPVSSADFDLYVLQGGSIIATSASSSDPESVFIPAVSGSYIVRTVPFAPAGQSITGTVSLESIPAAPPAGSGTPGRYISYAAPADLPGAGSAGEPSIGIDWNPNVASLRHDQVNTGGVAFYTANLNEFRVNFDDCSSPATTLWEDKTSPTESVETLDPIGFVDHVTGRVFQSQLAGASSLIAFSDTDGEAYTQSQGSGQPAGVDHQTVGGGPYNEAAVPPPIHPTYPNQVYYVSQDIATALAARSDNGGLTFGPGIPIYNLSQCGGLHGHVKVGPDGTVYVPNKSCSGAQGVAVSSDNGLTWTVRTVPGSLPADTDPSVGIGSDNTVYLGYQNGDGHPHIATSTDHGVTWTDRDVGQGFIKNCVFPEVTAGDGNRAAFAFLGTTTSGNASDGASFRGVWYFYIATTLDRGSSYTLVDATNGDPVQVGSICTAGTTCGDDRNLLDFMDLQIDREGRVLGAYADGCLAPDCNADTANGTPPYSASRSAFSSIIRQSGGPRLLAAFDPVEPKVPDAPRVDSVTRNTNQSVHVAWSTPDNGGSPLTGYNVYRRTEPGVYGAPLATVTIGCPACKTSYDDATATATGVQYYYKVTAINLIGQGTNCREFPVSAAVIPQSPCTLPGITILTDPSNDELDMLPAHDVQSLSIAEPFSFAPDRLVFTLKMQNLATVPPNTEWPVTFTAPNSVNYTVRMTTVVTDGSNGTTPIFQYGPTAGPFTTADPSSNYNADGTITIVVPRSGVGNPAVGQQLGLFLTRIAVYVGVSTLTPDNMPDSLAPSGSYTVVGNAACAPNRAPIASLTGSPRTGQAPLTVNFSAAASSDPDTTDTIVSYTFDFGDGTPAVTQTSPLITHTYTDSGAFNATVVVTDSRNKPSTNPAAVVIQVDTLLQNVVSRKNHAAVGPFDIILPADGSGIECRTGGANSDYTVVFTFATNVTTVDNATVQQGTATKSSTTVGPNPNQYTVNLTNVSNAQRVIVRLDGVRNAAGANLTDVEGHLSVLVGDTNGDGRVNIGDTNQTKNRSGQPTDATNFRSDVNLLDGAVNSGDTIIVRNNSGNALPPSNVNPPPARTGKEIKAQSNAIR